MIKDKSKVSIIITSLALMAFIIYINVHDVPTHVVYMERQYAADFSNDKILVGASHNIFIGKVIQQVGNKEQGIGPETQFSVEVIDNIKGELKGNIIVDQEGGYKGGVLYAVGEPIDILNKDKDDYYTLKTNSTYLFTTRYNKKENWYTLNSFPTALRLISSKPMEAKNLKTLAANNFRVKALREAYKNEILLDADIKNNNTLNNYKSIKGKADTPEAVIAPTSTSVENNDVTPSMDSSSSPETN